MEAVVIAVETANAVQSLSSEDFSQIMTLILKIAAAVTGNPKSALLGLLGSSFMMGILYMIFKRWAKKKGKEAAKEGEVIDRGEFIDREGSKSEERNDKDNEGIDKLKDFN